MALLHVHILISKVKYHVRVSTRHPSN